MIPDHGILAKIRTMVINTIGIINVGFSSSENKIGTLTGFIYGSKEREIAMMQQFGFASLPPSGSEGVVAAVAGSRENSYVIATHHRGSYPQGELSTGQCIFFHQDVFTFIKMKGSGDITIKQVGSGGTITINGNLDVIGNITATGTITP